MGTIYTTSHVQDGAGNESTCSTRWTVTDTVAPWIELVGPEEITLDAGSEFVDPGAMAHDLCMYAPGGSANITATGTVNTQVPGTYTLTYAVTDPSGNSAVPRTRTEKVLPTPWDT
ncbi:immunoglobulin-like domain-containing protein [Cystobacter fuscus]|uniref:immunoglobulin-like domain-containing protein n=1 Tax=Cystobacter fuscus TaxID=43 RepID=UPI0012FDB58F|nr:immunoglobulin-like domain-containing protein [Cystobacter fuscus]